MTGTELAEAMTKLSLEQVLDQASAWISDSLSAHYECGGDAPPEGLGKALCAELAHRADAIRKENNGAF